MSVTSYRILYPAVKWNWSGSGYWPPLNFWSKLVLNITLNPRVSKRTLIILPIMVTMSIRKYLFPIMWESNPLRVVLGDSSPLYLYPCTLEIKKSIHFRQHWPNMLMIRNKSLSQRNSLILKHHSQGSSFFVKPISERFVRCFRLVTAQATKTEKMKEQKLDGVLQTKMRQPFGV